MGIPNEELHRLIDRLSPKNAMRVKRYVEKLLKDAPPNSAAAPRPGDRPYYIAQNCPQCGTPLVLADLLDNPTIPEDEIWYDEFACPVCRDGIYLDWPEGEHEPLEEGCVDWNEFKRELGL